MDKNVFEKLSGKAYREIFQLCREDPNIDSSDPDIQFLLALCVRDGRGIRPDREMFERVLDWCVEKGSLLALGYCEGFARGYQELEQYKKEQEKIAASGNAANSQGTNGQGTSGQRTNGQGNNAQGTNGQGGNGRGTSGQGTNEKPVVVLYLTRPSKRQLATGSVELSDETITPDETPQHIYTSTNAPRREMSAFYKRFHAILAANNEPEIAKYWKSGNFKTLLSQMPENERREILAELLVKLNHFRTAGKKEMADICRHMVLAALEGKVSVSDLCLEMKNENGEKEIFPALWFAIWLGDPMIANNLLRRGANPNLGRQCRLPGGITMNRFPIGESILQGNEPIMVLLLNYGAYVNVFDRRTAADGSESLTSMLAYAVLTKRPELVQILLEHGANIADGYHFKDKNGKWQEQSPLFLASLLLAKGADPKTAGPLDEVTGELRTLLQNYGR